MSGTAQGHYAVTKKGLGISPPAGRPASLLDDLLLPGFVSLIRHPLTDRLLSPTVSVAREELRRWLGPARIARAKRALAPAFKWDLTRLGRWYGTNKAMDKQLYTPLYVRHLKQLRRRSLRLLEIGIGGYQGGVMSGGGSLRMWRTWFPKSLIVGIDLEPRVYREPRIVTYAGSQADADFLRMVESDAGPFDVIIDDGSHISEHIVRSFEVLWPSLNSGGFYIIEDLQTAYETEYGGGPPGTPGTSVEMLKELLDSPTLGGDVAALHMYPRIAFVEKRSNTVSPHRSRALDE